jgi:uncharacterized protein (TIGR03435 family)
MAYNGPGGAVLLKPILIALCSLAAQAQTAQPSFEVASIKPAAPLGPMGMRADRRGGPGTSDPGTYTCANCPVNWVLDEAYDLQAWEYVGPDWVHNVRFDFAAKIPTGTTKEVFRNMLQNLLATRFKLSVHREKRPMEVYELTLAKNGPKFHESGLQETTREAGEPAGGPKRDRDGFPILTNGASMAVVSGHARIRSADRPLSWFVKMLSGQLQGPVIDSTGLAAKYDFTVSWAFSGNSSIPTPADGPVPVLEPYGSALIEAVQSQLGLKLERKKGQAEVLVVDHLEKTPTEN